MTKNKEYWTDIVGYEGLYRVSSYGNILGLKRNKLLKPFMLWDGLKVGLSINGVSRHFYVHRIVYRAFKGEINGRIDFVDGDKTNVHIENLIDVAMTVRLANAICRKVIDTESNVIYDSVADVARLEGVHPSSIRQGMNAKNGKFSKYKKLV